MMMPKHFDGGSSIFLLGACEWVEFRVGAGILWERLQPEWEAQVGTYACSCHSPAGTLSGSLLLLEPAFSPSLLWLVPPASSLHCS